MIRVDTTTGTLSLHGQAVRCAIGKGGARPAAAKQEGDGATPLGQFQLVGALLRPDRMAAPVTGLPWRWLRPDDGWSDAPADPAYNRPVSHPHRFSSERLWRDDHVYDVIIILSHNSRPVVPGAGSAVFWHLARPDFAPTEGCLAIAAPDMLALMPQLSAGQGIDIG